MKRARTCRTLENFSRTSVGTPIRDENLSNPPFKLSIVRNVYLDVKAKIHQENTRNLIIKAYDKAIRFFGDVCFTTIQPADVDRFLEYLAQNGLRRGGMLAIINIISAGIRCYTQEFCLLRHNPMARCHRTEFRSYRMRRNSLGLDELAGIQAACRHKDDDTRWLISVISDTGARYREIAGLAISDFRLASEPPHLIIQPHLWRELRSVNHRREIPLVGSALWAAERIVANSSPGQVYAFPRLFRFGRLSVNLQGTISYWLRTRSIEGGIGDLRRTFVERLRKHGCPEYLRSQIIGWSRRGSEHTYGSGYRSKALHSWLQLLVLGETPPTKPRRGNEISSFECARIVMEVIPKVTYPSAREIATNTSIRRHDVSRGINHARSAGCIRPIFKAGTCIPYYELTGIPLPNRQQQSHSTPYPHDSEKSSSPARREIYPRHDATLHSNRRKGVIHKRNQISPRQAKKDGFFSDFRLRRETSRSHNEVRLDAAAPTLRNILEHYREYKCNRVSKGYIALITRTLAFSELIYGPDCRLSTITPKHARVFIERLLDRGLKTNSVRSYLFVLRTATRFYGSKLGCPIRNPFLAAVVPKLRHDLKQFDVISADRIAQLLRKCFEMDDDIRWLLTLLICTGARTSEICGAAIDDFKLDGPLPVLIIQPHSWRRLKTENSRRILPLCGLAVWAAGRICKTALPGQREAFPRYYNETKIRRCYTTLRWFLLSQDIDQPTHRLRHNFLDVLREVSCPLELQNCIMGWKYNTREAMAGFLPSIEEMARWMYAASTRIEHADTGLLVNIPRLSPREILNKLISIIQGSKGDLSYLEIKQCSGLSTYDLKRAIQLARFRHLIATEAPQGGTKNERRYRLTGVATADDWYNDIATRKAKIKLHEHLSAMSGQRLSLGDSCFPCFQNNSTDVTALLSKRHRAALGRKCEEGYVWSMPFRYCDKLMKTREAAEIIRAAMVPKVIYQREGIIARTGLSREEFRRGRCALYKLKVIETVRAGTVPKIAIRLTGKELPPRCRCTVTARSTLCWTSQHAMSELHYSP
ncbi:hypothetical protein LMG32289_05378 [Cupriavidus pampae]|uniref:Integrase n=1 Tax=Cupriavidus pampae TaxID=659251 RepID=A0ABM8XSW2_9BURK|nr:hypothetical protein LMG32289_05378 [Cupriavidus pampae]